AGAVLGSVVGLGISGATSASRADQSVAAMIGWVGGAAAGVTTDLVIDRLSRQRAPDPVAGARTTGDWAFLGVSALDMTERGGRGAVPGVELRWLQRPPVGVASRLN